METPEQKDLELFIHQQLQKLPERQAPEDLVVNIMAAIAAREKLPWWKQPFTSWPRSIQSVLFLVLASVFSAACYLAWRPAEVVSVDSITERASSLSWIVTLFSSVADALVVLLRALSWEWLAGIAVVFCTMYAASVAAGVALYRVSTRGNSHAV